MIASEAVAVSALAAGALDISATSVLMRTQRVSVQRLLQVIASGALGSSAFEMGTTAASIGLGIHFFIAASVATIYYFASHSFSLLATHPVYGGVIYGVLVHIVMSRVIVPLSRAPKRTFSMKAFLIQLFIHIAFVGLPISLTQFFLNG